MREWKRSLLGQMASRIDKKSSAHRCACCLFQVVIQVANNQTFFTCYIL
jgi:hypothetical protein